QVAPAERQEIRRAGPGAYEMNGHRPSPPLAHLALSAPLTPSASAQVARPSPEITRGPSSRAPAPAAASAAASARLPVPRAARDASECVRVFCAARLVLS